MSNTVSQSNAISKEAVYALLADNVYWDVRMENKTGDKGNPNRTKSNWTPVPPKWTVIAEVSGSGEEGKRDNPELEGFTARAYQNTESGEIVIAYAGTEFSDVFGDWDNNLKLWRGRKSTHAEQAAIFYQQLKKDYPDAEISFTGHSLGGGLAGLMGVWFDRPAYIFDHAPFQDAAVSRAALYFSEDEVVFDATEEIAKVEINTVSRVKTALMKAFGSVAPAFAGYTPADFAQRATGNLHATAVSGEVLDKWSPSGRKLASNQLVLGGKTGLGSATVLFFN